MAEIWAIIKAIPVLYDAFMKLSAYIVATEIKNMKQEHRDAIKKAVLEHDQRDLERAIGNPRAGEPSGIPGVRPRP